VTPPTEEQLLSLYQEMLRIRTFEDEVLRRKEQGLAIHSCAGHDAVAVGVVSQLTKGDLVVSNHRPWGHFLAKGGNFKESFAELYGKPEGVCKGLGGEMNLCKPEVGFVQSTMIVGACLTFACGVALAIKRGQNDRIAVVFLGDATSTNGAFNEALTMAATFKLPLLFVCENNGINGNTLASDYMPTELVIHRALGYGFPTNVCDGSDVLAVWETAQKAIEYVREKRTPYFLECLVARINYHKVPRFPDTRPPEVRRMARMRDPLPKLRNALYAEGILDSEKESRIKDIVHGELQEAIALVG
jgi:pyruvate dehydrogenase E1 component alpha subunit